MFCHAAHVFSPALGITITLGSMPWKSVSPYWILVSTVSMYCPKSRSFILQLSTSEYMKAVCFAASWLPHCSQFSRPLAMLRKQRSTALFAISIRPHVRKAWKPSLWPHHIPHGTRSFPTFPYKSRALTAWIATPQPALKPLCPVIFSYYKDSEN